jgi:Zinc finger, C3HC4 type (RING finger)
VYESEKLAAIKNHLSCPLCDQIFTSPCFLSGCGHTFCGLCLRQRFSWRNECPQCKASARPSDLTTSLALNAIVSAYLRFDARAACLQQPTSSAANVPDDIEESSINYSLSSVLEVPGDSDHDGKCSKELKEIDSAVRTSLTAVTTDEMQRGEDSDEDESVWASAKLPAHRKDDNLQVFSELIHRKKKRKTFSNGDIRVFAIDNRTTTSSSSSTKKSLHTAPPTVTAIKSGQAAVLGTVLVENMDGVITTEEQSPERSSTSHKNTINLTHNATPDCTDSQIGKYTSSGSSLQITGERKDDTTRDVQIHDSAARAYEREQTPLTNKENDRNKVHSNGARDAQNSAIKYSALKSRTLEDIDRGKDEKEDGTLFANHNVEKNQSSVNERKVSTTVEIIDLEHSVENVENVPEAIEDSPPCDSPYNPVDLTGFTGKNRNHEYVNGNSSKYDEMAAVSDGKECSIEGSQVSLVISVTDNRNDTYDTNDSDNIDNNYNDNFHENDENEYSDIEKNEDGNRNSGSNSNIGFINDVNRSNLNDDGINFYDSDDDNNNEIYDDNDTNANTNNNGHNDNNNRNYDYENRNCNDNHINTNNHGDKIDQNNDRSYLKINGKINDKNMCNNSDTDADNDNDNDSTPASNNSSYTTIRPDALHDKTASSYLSHTESAVLLRLKSDDKSSSSSNRKSNGDNNDYNDNSNNNNINSSSDNNNGSSYSSSSQIVDSYSHPINRHNPYSTTAFSNSTSSSSSIPTSIMSSSSDPHTLNSTIIPDTGPRSAPIPGLLGIPIKHNDSHTNYIGKNEHNLDGRLDYLDGVLDSQVTVGTDDTSDECHTKNWTQNLECSANGEDSCADMVDKVRVQIVCYYVCIFVF